MAWQVDPVVTETENGEVITDFTASKHQTLHRGMVDPEGRDMIEQEDGTYKHVMEDVELEDEGSSDYEADYIEAIFESEPDLHQAIAWAERNLPESFLEDYNAAIDSDDWDDVHQAINRLLDLYYEENPEEEEEFEENETDEVFEPPTQEEVDQTVDTLVKAEPEGTEKALEFLQAADASEDPIERDILMMSAQFHRGEAEASFLIQQAIERYGQDAVAPYVRRLMA